MTSLIARQYGSTTRVLEEAGDRGDEGGGKVDDVKTPAQTEAELKAAKEATDKAEADAKAKRDADVRIPKDRFDAAVRKEREATERAEARAKEAEERLAKQVKAEDADKIQTEIDTREEELDKALADNDADAKKRLRGEIRALNQKLARAEAQHMATAATAIAIEQNRYDGEVARMEETYPFLNPDLEDGFDEELAGEVMELKGAYEATGMGSQAALKKAATILGGKLREKAAAIKAELEKETPAQEEARKKKEAQDKIDRAEADAAKTEEGRRAAAVGKGLDAKGKQPPGKPGAAGTADRDLKDKATEAARMSDKDFAKLTEDDLKRARGDTA